MNATVESLRVRNFRALRDVELVDLSALTMVCGPNGSGKSSLLDVFRFLHEAFTGGLRPAWQSRGGVEGIRSRGRSGPVRFEFGYRVGGDRFGYTVEVDQARSGPVVRSERLRWVSPPPPAGQPVEIVQVEHGVGRVFDSRAGEYTRVGLAGPDLLAVPVLGQVRSHPHVAGLRRFVEDWHSGQGTVAGARSATSVLPQPRLNRRGDNLANVVAHLRREQPDRLAAVVAVLAARVPGLDDVRPQQLGDDRWMLTVKDRPFQEPVPARDVSDGTLLMLAWLVLFNQPEPPAMIGLDGPEMGVHPRLLSWLADDLRVASGHSQVVVATHSPGLVSAVVPDELWLLDRDGDGFARAGRAGDMPRVRAMVDAGASLGDLWREGYLVARSPHGWV